MKLSRTRLSVLLSSVSALAVLAACGGGGSSSPTAPVTTQPTSVTTTTQAAATPTPNTSATPWDCNRSDLAAGPVATYRFKLKAIRRDGVFIEGPPEGSDFQRDSQGRIMVRVGDFLTFDSTQKNGSGQQCQWDDDPRWRVNGNAFSVRTEASRQTTACNFLLRGDVVRTGEFTIDASLDGIDGETVYERDPVITLIAR